MASRLRRALAFAALVCAACAGGKDDGGNGAAPGPTPELTLFPTFTLSGGTGIERGECVGFQLHAEAFQFDEPRVQFGGFELASAFVEVVDPATVEVGAPCFFTGLDLPLGPMAVAVLQEDLVVVASSALTVAETTRLDLGDAPASSATLPDADANVLSAEGDFDVYEWRAPGAGTYLVEVVVTSAGTASLLPYSYVARASLSRSWLGHERVLVPVEAAGNHLVETADVELRGGAGGFGYAVEVSGLGTPGLVVDGESCDGGAPAISDGLHLVDLTAAEADLDPQGEATCADRHASAGVSAGGADRVVRLVVASGATLAVAARSATTDAVLYLLEDDGADCAVVSCLAAADTFGPVDTETLLWRNDGPDRSVFLVVDDFGGIDSQAGPVEIFVEGALPP